MIKYVLNESEMVVSVAFIELGKTIENVCIDTEMVK